MVSKLVSKRFRGFLPVVVDVETAGFVSETDALLEIAAIFLDYSPESGWRTSHSVAHHVVPFLGSNIEQSALDFNNIDPFHPFRKAVEEKVAITNIFQIVHDELEKFNCTRAILVGHNPTFDLAFVKAASSRVRYKKFPFHHFSTFDTAALSGVAFGQTVLARAVVSAGHQWDQTEAHSAIYDAQKTADLFCTIVNKWDHFNSDVG